jgi:hypothetical protein
MPTFRRAADLPAVLAAVAALAACDPSLGTRGTALPARPVTATPATTPPPSPESTRVRAHYAKVQANLLSQGLLRTDGGARDTPFTDRELAANFIRIALFDEYDTVGGRIVQTPTKSLLHRWDQPIRMAIEFGPTVPLPQQRTDRGNIAAFTQRLSRLTGLPIRVGAADPNFTVLILNEDERRRAGPRLAALRPGIAASKIAAVTSMDLGTECLVFSFQNQGSESYGQAIAVIRGELPDLMRMSCINEELAQSLGVANDSPAARPSIFNDNEEFALLTLQDELMLRILYDRRLRPGMTADEAAPVVQQIAAELMGGQG